jgi:hypothetical protein
MLCGLSALLKGRRRKRAKREGMQKGRDETKREEIGRKTGRK